MQTLLEFAESLYQQKNVKPRVLRRLVSVIQESLPVSGFVHVGYRDDGKETFYAVDNVVK